MVGPLPKAVAMTTNSTASMSPDLPDTPVSGPMFFVVSIRKMIVMNLFTFGLYWAFCHYQSWALYRRETGERVLPLVRSIFGILFLYSLLSRVDRQLHLSGRSYRWSPFWLVCALILLTALSLWANQMMELAPLPLLSAVLAMDVLILWVVARIQGAINTCVGDPKGQSNSRLSLLNWAWMSVGILVWVVLVSFLVVLLAGLFIVTFADA